MLAIIIREPKMEEEKLWRPIDQESIVSVTLTE